MTKRVFAFLFVLVLLLAALAVPVCADEESADTSEAAAETENEFSDSAKSIELPTPVIDKAYLGENDDGEQVIFVEGTPHEDLAPVDEYLAANGSYPIRVEFNVSINNEEFLKTSSCGELASEGKYSFEMPVSYSGKHYDPEDAYIQIQMRYVFDYDWIRITQSEWSNTVEVNSHLSGLNYAKRAENANTVRTLLWIGGGVILVVLVAVMFVGGDTRCPNCRARMKKKTAVCPSCGYDVKHKRMPEKAEDTPAE